MKFDSDIEFEVGEDVYTPDADTYLLLDVIELEEGGEVLEIGCGSGIISLHCAEEGWDVTAVDVCKDAVEGTKRNVRMNDLLGEVKVHQSDLFSNVDGRYDVMIFNPPYLPEDEELEKDERWDGGERGDETLLTFLDECIDYLNEGGRVYTIYSDKAPIDKVEKKMEQLFSVAKKEKKDFRFETIFAVELVPE